MPASVLEERKGKSNSKRQKQGTDGPGGPKLMAQARATVKAYALKVLLAASGITGVPEQLL